MNYSSLDSNFIRKISSDFNYPLKDIKEFADSMYIPIIKPEVASFLNFIIKLKKPKNILEIGTAIGFSAIIMANAYEISNIITIEKDIERAEIAKDNFKRAGLSKRIELICGDANDVLPNLNKKYDLIFIDASKGHYKEFYQKSMRILNNGGLFVCDNILYKGYVVSEKNVKHKRRTIVYRMREFIETLKSDNSLITTIVPLGDGLSLSIKEEK